MQKIKYDYTDVHLLPKCMQLNLCNPWQKKTKTNSHVLEDHEIMVKTMCTFHDPEIKML